MDGAAAAATSSCAEQAEGGGGGGRSGAWSQQRRQQQRQSFAPDGRVMTSDYLWLHVITLVTVLSSKFEMGWSKASEFDCREGKTQNYCLPSNYSKFELPETQVPNKVTIDIEIHEVLKINDKDYTITFSCFFNVLWQDRRIKLHPDFGREIALAAGTQNWTNNPDVMVPTSLEFIKHLWQPNILIYNLKIYKVMDVLSLLAGMWVYTDKKVYYSQSTHITFICPMRFDKFPLDTQICFFKLGSYSYTDAQMTFTTKSAAYGAHGSNTIALDYAITISKLEGEEAVLDYYGANYSLAGFEMRLQRHVSTYIITYYLPSGLFVIVSWISFLIPMEVVPGRMSLLVTLFLVLVNIFNTVTTNTPKAEGLTAIEAWMLACILFVFGALVE